MCERSSRYYCVYCNVDVSGLRVRCAECLPEFNLCPQCFACGAEIGHHLKTHAYSILTAVTEGNTDEKNDMPLFPLEKNWKESEELELLNKVFRYGFGSWDLIANVMGKTAKEVEDHFLNVYVNGNIGRETLSLNKPLENKDHTEELPNDVSNESENSVPKEIFNEISYLPKKSFFYDTGYDTDAESIICDIVKNFGKSNTSNVENKDDENALLLSAIKVACVNIYRKRLKVRCKMEKVISDYNLIKLYSDSSAAKSNQTSQEKAESDLRDQMKVYCRLMNPADHEALIQGEMKERKLREELKKLKANLKGASVPNTSVSRADVTEGKQGTFKENKCKKGMTSARKEAKTSKNVSSSSKSKKRPFQEENTEAAYAANCHDLLSQAEKKVCTNLGIEPSSYMALKIVFLKECNIMVSKDAPNPVCNLSPANINAVEKVSSFLSNNGWIKTG